MRRRAWHSPPLYHSAIYDVVEEKADSEPDFQYIPEKSPQDPSQLDQHALRDSMVALKEGLASGAILAQFDVRRIVFDFHLFLARSKIQTCKLAGKNRHARAHTNVSRNVLRSRIIYLYSVVLFLQQLYRKRPGMTMLCAKLPQNISKNRYRDISPCMWL